ncbi:hypothetical protein [Marinospirillum minutulum]|uniref:hypothetical protein n=1 Tax=Marinospirillum minutulum TaxID=64974 RepID=UPI000422BA42|nr:hypothetical protein [Marinospirillum minutulum]
MDRLKLSTWDEKINTAAKTSAKKANRKQGNLEDQLRVANELLRGLEILQASDAVSLEAELTAAMQNFAESILQSEAGMT